MKKHTPRRSPQQAGHMATEPQATGYPGGPQVLHGSSDHLVQTAASTERGAMASLHRQRRRDVLKRRRSRGKSSEPPVRDRLLPTCSFLSLSTRSPRKSDRDALDTGVCTTAGSRYTPSELSRKVWQLEQENQQLRDMLHASQCTCGELEPSRRDLTDHFEAEEHRMAGDRGPMHGGGRRDAMLASQDELGLRHVSGGSLEFTFDAWQPMAMMPGLPQDFPSGDVEHALWEAANRPSRPNGWASMPSSPWPAPHAEPRDETFGINGLAAPMEYPQPPQAGPKELNDMPRSLLTPQAGQQKLIEALEAPRPVQPSQQELSNMPEYPQLLQAGQQNLDGAAEDPDGPQPSQQKLNSVPDHP